MRQLMLFGGLNFTRVFAKLRRNPVEPERAVNLFFGFAGHTGVVVKPIQPVLVQGESHLECPLAKRYAVTLRAGEILQAGAVRLWRQSANIHLQSRAQLEADLVVALGEYLVNAGEAGDFVEQYSPL